MRFAYLGFLVCSLMGMLLIDRHYRLAFFEDVKRTALTVGIGVLVFAVWDIAGINLGIFYAGESRYSTGILLGPDFPLEELFFLTFLCYFSLIVYRFWEVKCKRI